MRTVQEIKAQLGHGDYAKIGKMVGVTRIYARQLIDRPTAAKHNAVKAAAERILDLVSPAGE